MYAVIKVAGQQIRVEKGQKVRVPKLDAGEGDVQEFTEVLSHLLLSFLLLRNPAYSLYDNVH